MYLIYFTTALSNTYPHLIIQATLGANQALKFGGIELTKALFKHFFGRA